MILGLRKKSRCLNMKMDSIIHKRSFRLRRTPLYDRKYKKHNTFHDLLAYHVPLAVAVPGAAVAAVAGAVAVAVPGGVA